MMAEQVDAQAHKKLRTDDGAASAVGDQGPGGAQPRASSGGGAAAAATATVSSRLEDGIPDSKDSKLVLVWDLDETLLIFNSLVTGTWAAAQRCEPGADDALLAVGSRWEAAILRLCDEHFFFDVLQEYDQTCLAEIQQYDDGASLAGYGWSSDGFPPPSLQPEQRRHSPQQHASAAHPAPYPAAAAAAAAGLPAAGGRAPEPQQQQQPAGRYACTPGAPGSGAAADVTATAAAAASPATAAVVALVDTGYPDHSQAAAPLSSPASSLLDAASLAKLAYRYRRIVKLFTLGLQALGTAVRRQEWEALYKETDGLTGGWLSHANALLAGCSTQLAGSGSSRGCAAGSGHAGAAAPGSSAGSGGDDSGSWQEVVHVAVTSGQLIPSLAKLLLFKLGRHIKAEHLWSSRYRGKRHCFELVRQRFGGGCTYVAIGDGIEEDEAAAALGWPYVRVLLAQAEHYPAERVLSWRPDAASGGPGLAFTQLTLQHIARAAGMAGSGGEHAAQGGAAAGGGVAVAAATDAPCTVPSALSGPAAAAAAMPGGVV